MNGFAHRLAVKLLRLHERIHHRTFGFRHTGARPKHYVLKPYSSSAPTRIYHVNGNFAVGGSTQLIVDLIERMSDHYTQEVIVPDAPFPLPYQPVTVHAISLTEMTRVRDLLEKARPAAVHVHYWVREGDEYVTTALWYHAVFDICARLGIPVIQNINVPTVAHASPAVVHNVYVSRYVEDAYDQGLAPASVIYPGSDFDHFAVDADRHLPDDVIGMVYRLDHDKLDERSIEVFIETAKRRPATRCLIVGGGQFLDLYKRRVAKEELQDQFEFTGFVSYDALPELYRQLSIFVAPVHNESFGQVTPFAMSMGLPVAGYRIGALPEILGPDAPLVEQGDANTLADRLIALLDDRAAREKLGAYNRQRAHAMFSVEAMIAGYRDLYAERAPVQTS